MRTRYSYIPGFAPVLIIVLLALSAACSPTPTATPAKPTPTRPPGSTATATTGEEFQEGLAKHLSSTGAIIYTLPTCSHCQEQKGLFGTAVEYLNEVNCAIESQRCSAKGFNAVPTWEIEGKLYTGTKTLDQLARLSGYTGP
jgi:hypothetical protein